MNNKTFLLRLESFLGKLILLLVVGFIIIFTVKEAQHPIFGNKYIVTSVEHNVHASYKYTVEIECVDSNSNRGTVNGNYHTMYTNKLYVVGDTVEIK